VVPSPWSAGAQTLLEEAKAHAGARVCVLNRLDRDTSGIVLFGKTAEACRSEQHQFEARTVEKVYDAIVSGRVAQDRGRISLPIAQRRWGKAGIRRGGERAKTEYRVEERLGPVTWLKVFPKSGRFHQIRVHLAAIGHPLAYDPLYHKQGQWPWLKRLPLHAGALSLDHPATHQRLGISCALPADFQEALRRFR